MIKRIMTDINTPRPKNILRVSVFLYLLLLVVVIAVLLLVNLSSTSNWIRADIDRANMATLSKAGQMVDLVLQEIDNTAISLSSNSDVRRLILDNMQPSYPRAQSLSDLNSMFAKMNLPKLVRYVSIYSESSDRIFTPGYYVDAAEFSDKSWRDYYAQPGFNSGWIPTRSTQWMRQGAFPEVLIDENLITLMRLYPLNVATGQQRGAIMFHISEADLRNMVTESFESGIEIIVTDAAGDVLVSSANWPLGANISEQLDAEQISAAAAGEHGISVNISGQAHRIYVEQSGYTGWQFIEIVDESAVFRPVEDLRIVLTWVALVLLGLGVIVVLLINRMLYSPVQEFVGSLSLLLVKPDQGQTAENYRALSFESIAGQFADIVTERERVCHQLEESRPAIRRQVAMDILLGYSSDYYGAAEQLKIVNISLLPSNYIVMICELNDGGLNEVTAILQAQIDAHTIGCAVELGNRLIAGILSFQYNQPTPNMEEALAVASSVLKSVAEKLNKNMMIGIGEPCTAFAQISISYQEALEALKRAPISAEHLRVIRYVELPPQQLGAEYELSNKIDGICGALKTGDMSKLEQRLSSFAETAAQTHLSMQALRALYHSLILQTGAATLETGVALDEELQALAISTRRLCDEAQHADELQLGVHSLLTSQLKAILNQRATAQQSNGQAQAVVRYINENYTDPSISLTSIAEMMSLSPSYVSRLFRHATGENLSEALASIRIKHAQELLCKPGAQVGAVAQQVGFVSVHTFIRTFKKLTGQTPGKWAGTSGDDIDSEQSG